MTESVGSITLEATLEALLFVANQPLSLDRLKELVGDRDRDEVRQALVVLKNHYRNPHCGLRLEQVAGGYRLVTRPDLAECVEQLTVLEHKARFSRAKLETLAVIAYRARKGRPVTRQDIERIRGVDSSSHVRRLLDAGLIKIVGRKETLGRPQLFAPTEEFLIRFGLNDLEELPLPEWEEELLEPGEDTEAAVESGGEDEAQEETETHQIEDTETTEDESGDPEAQ